MKQITNSYVLTALACTGGMLFGFDVSSMSAILSTPNYLVYFGPKGAVRECPDRPGALCSPGPSADVQGGITASMAGGSFLGAIASGVITDKLGRRKAIFLSCILWIIGSVISCASQNVGMLVVGRIFNGACVGIASAQVPVYISELSVASIRGRLVGCQQWAITIGIAVFFYITYGCSFIGTRIDGAQDGRGTASFRVPWALQMIPAFILMGFLPFMPESPRWLALKNRHDEALQVLAAVHGNGDARNPLVQAEFKAIQNSIEESSGTSYLDLFRNGMAWRTHIAMFTQIWSQLTGMNVMMYYIGYIFEMAGETGNIALISSSIQYVINVLMTIPALLFMDKWGRRPTLLVGSTLMMVWMFANAGLLASYGHYVESDTPVRWVVTGAPAKAVIACTFLFVASYAPTWGPVSWTYPPELFPTRLRGKAGSVSTSCNWIFNFALGYFVPPAFRNIQWKSYILFGVFCFAMTVHVFFAFPETAGKSLEEVDEIFNSGVPAWRTRAIAKDNKTEKLARDIEAGAVDGPVYTKESSTPDSESESKEDIKA